MVRKIQKFDLKDLRTIGNSVSWEKWLAFMMEFTKHHNIKTQVLCFYLLRILQH